MTAQQFLEAATRIADKWPSARVWPDTGRNQIVVRDRDRPVAYIEGYDGEVVEFP